MQTAELLTDNSKPCINCKAPISTQKLYCNSCGAKQIAFYAVETDSWALLKQAACFYSLYILICSINKFTNAFAEPAWAIFAECIVAMIPMMFFILRWSDVKSLLQWPHFSLQKLSLYCGLAFAAGFIVHYAVHWLNITVYSRDRDLYNLYDDNRFAWLFMFFFIAVIPALFEEIGFRGYLLQTLLRVADKSQALYVSSFLFAVIHLNLMSLFWLMPVALLLGYVRIKENTIWYGVFMHFCFNLTACMFAVIRA